MEAIIFDIDGTLLHSSGDDDRLYRIAVETVLGKVRFRGSLHDYDHVSDTGILTQVFHDNDVAFDDEVFEAVRNTFFDSIREHIEEHGPFPEIPGAIDFIERISASPDHACAVATGGWRESASTKLDAAGFPFEPVNVATSDDAIDRADIMLHALRSLDGHFDTVTYYGDGPWDRSASERLGWSFVGVGDAIGGISSFHQQLPGAREG